MLKSGQDLKFRLGIQTKFQLWLFFNSPKWQLISERPFDVLDFPKNNKKNWQTFIIYIFNNFEFLGRLHFREYIVLETQNICSILLSSLLILIKNMEKKVEISFFDQWSKLCFIVWMIDLKFKREIDSNIHLCVWVLSSEYLQGVSHWRVQSKLAPTGII